MLAQVPKNFTIERLAEHRHHAGTSRCNTKTRQRTEDLRNSGQCNLTSPPSRLYALPHPMPFSAGEIAPEPGFFVLSVSGNG